MPGQTITLNFDQGSTAHLVMKDAAGVVTTDFGTYAPPAWTVDNPAIVTINPITTGPGLFACLFQAATPAVDGTATVTVALHSSDPAAHPDLTDSFIVTIANVPPPLPGPVSSIELTLDAPGPRLF